jgi:hypothetical protein
MSAFRQKRTSDWRAAVPAYRHKRSLDQDYADVTRAGAYSLCHPEGQQGDCRMR